MFKEILNVIKHGENEHAISLTQEERILCKESPVLINLDESKRDHYFVMGR